MFPVFRMRVFVALAVAVAGPCWWWATGQLLPADGAGGLTLLAGTEGPAQAARAVGWMLAAGLPAILLGAIVAALGSPLSGVFVVAGSLLFASARGGSMIGLIQRWELAGTLGVYGLLLAELALWLTLLSGLFWLMRWTRARVRMKLRRWAVREHFGADLTFELPRRPGAWGAGLICAAIGGFGTYVLTQSYDPGQVLGALLLSYFLAGAFAHLLLAQWNPVMILLGPLLSGAVGYLYVVLSFPSYEAFLAAAYAGQVWGLAMISPVQYAAAGVAGSVLGIGLGQAIEHSRPVQAAMES